jgi:hypothetical protein
MSASKLPPWVDTEVLPISSTNTGHTGMESHLSTHTVNVMTMKTHLITISRQAPLHALDTLCVIYSSLNLVR